MVKILLATALYLLCTASALAEITLSAQVSNPSPWIREEILLELTVVDDRSIIDMRIAPWAPQGFLLRELHPSEDRVQTEHGIQILRRQRWALTPLYAGTLHLQPPEVLIRATGQRLSLQAPPLELQVRPLNPLLPSDIPVGVLLIQAPQTLTESLPRGRPFHLDFQIQGTGLSVRGLNHWLEESLRDLQGLRVFPSVIRIRDADQPDQPLLQHADVRLSFEAEHSGHVPLPALTLPYIDPSDGTVRQARLPSQEVQIIHPLWHMMQAYLPRVVIWVLGGLMLWWMMSLAYRSMKVRRRKHHQLEQLRRAQSAGELRRAWQSDDSPAAHALQQRLDAACYAASVPDAHAFAQLKADLIQHVRKRRTDLK